jgi:hypothetical protein
MQQRNLNIRCGSHPKPKLTRQRVYVTADEIAAVQGCDTTAAK